MSERWAGRLLAAGLAGGVALGTVALGPGVALAAPAAPALTCPKAGTVLPALIPAACKTVSGATGAVTGAVPQVTAPVKSVVPKVTAPVKSVVPQVVTVVPRAAATKAPTAAAAAPSKAASPASAATASAAVAPASAAPAPVSAAPAVMSPAFVSAFGQLPASFLAGVGAPGSASVLGALGPVSGRYDPGLLLSSAQPLRALAASPVTTTSSALPLDLFPGQGRVGTPVLLSVLSVAVAAALAVRGGVLRRARRRAASS